MLMDLHFAIGSRSARRVGKRMQATLERGAGETGLNLKKSAICYFNAEKYTKDS